MNQAMAPRCGPKNVALLGTLAAQNTMMVVLMYFASRQDVNFLVLVWYQELSKIVLSACIIAVGRDPFNPVSPENRRVLAPLFAVAVLYVAQNVLQYNAAELLTPATYALTGQSKLVWVSIASAVAYHRIDPWNKHLGVGLMLAGQVTNVLATWSRGEDHSTTRGVVAMLAASEFSSVASVLFQVIAKHEDVHLSAMQLTLLLAVVSFLLVSVACAAAVPYLREFLIESPLVWGTIVFNAAGGLLVGAVVKHMTAIWKDMAIGGALVSTTAVSIIFMGTRVNAGLVLSVVLTVSAIYTYSISPPPLATLYRRFAHISPYAMVTNEGSGDVESSVEEEEENGGETHKGGAEAGTNRVFGRFSATLCLVGGGAMFVVFVLVAVQRARTDTARVVAKYTHAHVSYPAPSGLYFAAMITSLRRSGLTVHLTHANLPLAVAIVRMECTYPPACGSIHNHTTTMDSRDVADDIRTDFLRTSDLYLKSQHMEAMHPNLPVEDQMKIHPYPLAKDRRHPLNATADRTWALQTFTRGSRSHERRPLMERILENYPAQVKVAQNRTVPGYLTYIEFLQHGFFMLNLVGITKSQPFRIYDACISDTAMITDTRFVSWAKTFPAYELGMSTDDNEHANWHMVDARLAHFFSHHQELYDMLIPEQRRWCEVMFGEMAYAHHLLRHVPGQPFASILRGTRAYDFFYP